MCVEGDKKRWGWGFSAKAEGGSPKYGGWGGGVREAPPLRLACKSRSRSGTACRACAQSRAWCRGTAPPDSLQGEKAAGF